MGPKPVVIFGLNWALVEHKYYFPITSILKKKENVVTSWKRGIHLNSELGSWFKLVVFSIDRDRNRSSEKFTEPTPASTLGSFHDFQKEKVRLKYQSQKVYPCTDTFLSISATLLLFFHVFHLSPIHTFTLPKATLCGSKSCESYQVPLLLESSQHFWKMALFPVSSQTGSTNLNKANGKYALKGHNELGGEKKKKKGDRRRLFDFYFNSYFHDHMKTRWWESLFPFSSTHSICN